MRFPNTSSAKDKRGDYMARIAGVDLPKDKRVEIALTYIFGIGRSLSKKTLVEAGVDPNMRVKDLNDKEVSSIRDALDQGCKVEGDLRKEVSMNIKRLMDLGTYKGIRHRKGLPVRGQTTKNNARTRKGPKRTVAGRKK